MKKLIILLLLALSANLAEAQKRRKSPNKPNGNFDFLDTQWWLGIRSGLNFTNATPINRYPGFYPINYDEEVLYKSYEDFQSPAFQVGLDITFYHKGFSISTFPSFFKHNINYNSSVSWRGDASEEQFETRYNTQQSVTFIDLPIAVKYDFLNNKIRPFIMAGAFYSFVFDANKSVQVQEIDYAFGSGKQYDRTTLNLNNKEEFLNNWGVLGGLGASFDFWNIRTIIDIQYRHSFNGIIDADSRYRETVFSSFGEVQDDYSLANFSSSISFVFPLRYIDSQFKAL